MNLKNTVDKNNNQNKKVINGLNPIMCQSKASIYESDEEIEESNNF